MGKKFCPDCGKKMFLEKKNKRRSSRYKCTNRVFSNGIRKRLCSKTIPQKRIDILGFFKLPITTFLKILIFLSMKQKYNAIAYELNVSKDTIVKIMKLLCEKAKKSFPTRRKIGGANMNVEIDESHIFTHKYFVGRVLQKEKVWVVGGKCRETKECFFHAVNQRNKTVLNNLIINNVEGDSNVFTDMWRGYTDVDRLGFPHKMVNHKVNFVDPADRRIHTQNIEREWRSLKEFLPKPIKSRRVQNYKFLYIFLKEKNATFPSEILRVFLDLIKY